MATGSAGLPRVRRGGGTSGRTSVHFGSLPRLDCRGGVHATRSQRRQRQWGPSQRRHPRRVPVAVRRAWLPRHEHEGHRRRPGHPGAEPLQPPGLQAGPPTRDHGAHDGDPDRRPSRGDRHHDRRGRAAAPGHGGPRPLPRATPARRAHRQRGDLAPRGAGPDAGARHAPGLRARLAGHRGARRGRGPLREKAVALRKIASPQS